MESFLKLLGNLPDYGPGFLVAAVGFALYFMQWRRNNLIADKLYEVSMAFIKTGTESKAALLDLSKASSNHTDAVKDLDESI